MVFAGVLIVLLGVYLVIEERERSAANPGCVTWLVRVRKSGRRKLGFLMGIILGVVLQLIRKKDLTETFALGGVAVLITLFLILHEATLELPRNEERKKP